MFADDRLAKNFKLYCQTLVKLLGVDREVLTGAEAQLLEATHTQIRRHGLAFEQSRETLGNTLWLKLEPGTRVEDGVLQNSFHEGFGLDFLSLVADGLEQFTQRLQRYYVPEPEKIMEVRPHSENPSLRYVTTEWAHWITTRNDSCKTICEIGLLAGLRFHELMLKAGDSPIKVGESLKVDVDAPDARWAGQDIPVRLYRITHTEF